MHGETSSVASTYSRERTWTVGGRPTKTKRRIVEVVSSILFRVIPVIFAGLWVLAYKDFWMAAPYIVVFCAYNVWCLFDLGASYREKLLNTYDDYLYLLLPVIFCFFVTVGGWCIIYGVSFDVQYFLWVGIADICLFSVGMGYVAGEAGFSDD
ncbi:hypothetical protein MAPG_07225 [Magnaporthiopsis poae ATCC 64411]|uniref:Uncharacterized protein n=1 Tax=Magnaporthiopsis poae (strain ATCC 64411 / 73-15) TaxID=644358 RepID=A0A0C4E437_MAGP6|nr:hypothetical protein MAPG_07225 [Magnaporthiopsis poae ATCC 64411]